MAAEWCEGGRGVWARWMVGAVVAVVAVVAVGAVEASPNPN